ncbi:hypothetical protein H0H92_013642 [Tricholoma furcatifolium]|nr:hypothetical protein H0H92_013642 [Tricholoma furcatifolium]
MAELFRDAKSGNNWSTHELKAYKIQVDYIDEEDFFRDTHTTMPHDFIIDNGILHDEVSAVAAEYLGHLRLALKNNTHETHIDDLVRETLKLTGYKDAHSLICTGHITSLRICGNFTKVAQTDVALIHQHSLMLLVIVEDKASTSKVDPEPQVIAEAISAFQHNNHISRHWAFRLPPLDKAVIPCITVTGMKPVFYLVPVTRALDEAVRRGEYPTEQTRVHKCRMRTSLLSDREHAFLCFLNFRLIAEPHWQLFLEDVNPNVNIFKEGPPGKP